MADMFAPLVAQLKANPKTIVFTEGNDPRILEAASKLLAEGVLKVVMVGNEAECKAAAAAGNFDISAAEIIDPENYAGFDEMVNTMVELRKGKQTAEECTMPSPDNPTGKCAYLMNIYTKPQFRKQGVGEAIIKWLVEQAIKRGISKIYLETSESGKRLYTKFGFVPMQDMMKLPPKIADIVFEK